MKKNLFGSSGIRAVFNKDLLQLAQMVGLAAGRLNDNVLVGNDTRTSSQAMKYSLISGLLASGAECQDAGTLPTPTLAYAGSESKATIMVTASHNPAEFNGLKPLNPDGAAFDAVQRKQIEDMIFRGDIAAAPWQEIKECRNYSGAVEKHIARIRRDFPEKLKLRVVLDCNCGAASVITPYLLREMGCEVIALNCHPTGFFPHEVEPVAANLDGLMKAVTAFGANLGIVHDGDSDRMMAVDDRGRFISGDRMLVILARAAKAKRVVTTVDASMIIEEAGFTVARTRVGDIYVSDELKEGGEFGGEPSGAWVFPDISLCPDGIYAAARIAEVASRQRLSALVDEIPDYPIVRGSISISKNNMLVSSLEGQLMSLEPLSVDNTDGTKLNFRDGWLLVRPSGTESKIRLTVEAKSEYRAHRLYESAARIIHSILEDGGESA